MKISIIIPVYNVEKYVGKCLRSCLSQDFPRDDYEIIVINDGSTDKSLTIVEECARTSSNIHIITQVNQGLSVARNIGMKAAKGEYIWFVDSDDWIEENCLSKLAQKLDKNIDLLQLCYRYVYEDDTPSKDFIMPQKGEMMTGKEVTLRGGLIAQAQFTIYRRSFLINNHLEFVRGIYHEDSEFKPRATLLAKTVYFDDVVCYNYLQRTSGSITSKFSLKRATDILTVMNNLYEFSKSYGQDIQRALNCKIGMNMNSLLFGYRTLSSEERRNTRKMLISNKHLFKRMLDTNRWKYRFEGAIFIVSVKMGFALHRLIR